MTAAGEEGDAAEQFMRRMVGDQLGLSEQEKKEREARTEIAYRDGLWAPIP